MSPQTLPFLLFSDPTRNYPRGLQKRAYDILIYVPLHVSQ